MKNKYFYIKLSIIASLIIIVVLWILLLLIPTNKYIYNANIKIKELKRKIVKYKNDKDKFEKTNLAEQRLMKGLSNKFFNKFYIVKNQESLIKFYRNIYDHVQYYEKKVGDRIADLQITNEVSNNRFAGNYRNTYGNKDNKTNNPLVQLIPNLKNKTINISFNGELKDTLNFINHITWCNNYVSIKELKITDRFKLALKIFYIDKRTKEQQSE
jgi:hypothetical protein